MATGGYVHRVLATVAVLCLASWPSPARPPVDVQAEDLDTTIGVANLVRIGDELSSHKQFDEAIGTFSDALKKDPGSGLAFAGRSIAYASTNRLDEASADADAAERLLGDEPAVHRARALIAMRRSDDKSAIAELTKALSKEPGDRFSLYYRAWLFQGAHSEVAALADADSYITAYPRAAEAYILRGRLLIAQNKPTLALIDADRLVRLFPDDSETLAAASEIYGRVSKRNLALKAIDRAIALRPDAFLYRYIRAKYLPWDAFDQRRADLDAAHMLEPENLDVVTQLALLNFKQRRWPDAILGFSQILAKEPKDFGILAYRAMAQRALGKTAEAEQDHAEALRTASGPDDFSKICWAFANEGMALDWALHACDLALASKPNDDAYLSNRGLVELRLGHLDRAAIDYDQAIASDATNARAWYGRALVHLRQGQTSAAEKDRQQAQRLDPGIEEVFEEYGLGDFTRPAKPK